MKLSQFRFKLPEEQIALYPPHRAFKNEDGTVSVQTYLLVYEIGEGYTAYRLYGNNDAEEHAKRPFNTILKLIKDFFQKIVDAIKNLFKKG